VTTKSNRKNTATLIIKWREELLPNAKKSEMLELRRREGCINNGRKHKGIPRKRTEKRKGAETRKIESRAFSTAPIGKVVCKGLRGQFGLRINVISHDKNNSGGGSSPPQYNEEGQSDSLPGKRGDNEKENNNNGES